MTKTPLDTLDPIFADCVGESDRLTIDKPWIRKGHVYATNGAIVIRQPTELPETVHRGPAAWQTFDDLRVSGRAILLPDIGPKLADTSICGKCKGKNSTKTCSECKGMGKHTCPTCEHVKPCRLCEGEGKLYCSECKGEGIVTRKRKSIRLHARYRIGLADYYVWLLQRHGIKTVRFTTILGGGPSFHSFHFRKGKDRTAIEGVVMGMTLGSDDDG